MPDRIEIKGLLLRTVIGVNTDERHDRQDVLINLTLYTDTRPAGRSDELRDTLDYRALTKRVITLVEESRFYLVERLAAAIADLCLEDACVERVSVTVEKPGALRFARSVGVTIDRGRSDG